MLDEGIPVLKLNTESGEGEVRARWFPISDGRWHRVYISQQGGSLSLSVDGGISYTNNSTGFFASLDLLHLGGVPTFLELPAGIAQLDGFIGCIADLVINGIQVELNSSAVLGVGITECKLIDKCAPGTCLNNGVCQENLLNYTCLCQLGFTGTNCQEGNTSIIHVHIHINYFFLIQM